MRIELLNHELVSHLLEGFVVVYKDYTKAYLRLPLSPFMVSVLRVVRFTLSQVTLPGIDLLVMFELLCHVLEIN